jgi:hypothetical protein
MCEATTLLVASLALSAATGASQYASQSKAVKAQKHARDRNLKRTEHATNRAVSQQYKALQDRLGQEQEASSQAAETAKRTHLRAVSSATVAAGEMGQFGNTAGDLEQLFALRAAEAEDTRTRNLGFVEAQILNSMQTVQEQQRTALANATGGSIAGVDIGGILGQAAGSAVGALGAYNAAQAPQIPGAQSVIPANPGFGQS